MAVGEAEDSEMEGDGKLPEGVVIRGSISRKDSKEVEVPTFKRTPSVGGPMEAMEGVVVYEVEGKRGPLRPPGPGHLRTMSESNVPTVKKPLGGSEGVGLGIVEEENDKEKPSLFPKLHIPHIHMPHSSQQEAGKSRRPALGRSASEGPEAFGGSQPQSQGGAAATRIPISASWTDPSSSPLASKTFNSSPQSTSASSPKISRSSPSSPVAPSSPGGTPGKHPRKNSGKSFSMIGKALKSAGADVLRGVGSIGGMGGGGVGY